MSVPQPSSDALATLLRCLERDDVSVLELCSGQTAMAVRAKGSVALTKTPLTEPQILALLQGTDIAAALRGNQGSPQELSINLASRPMRVVVQRTPERLRVAIKKERAEPASELAEAILQAPSPTSSTASQAFVQSASPAAAMPSQPLHLGASAVAAPPVPPTTQPTQRNEGIDLGDQGAVAQALSARAQQSAPRTIAATVPQATVHFAEPQYGAVDALARVDGIVEMARRANASDVHLIPEEPIRLRIATALTPHDGAVVPHAELAALASGLLDASQQSRLETLGYVDCAFALPTAGRVRVNFSRHGRGIKLSMRLVPSFVPTLQSLGLPEDLAAVSRYHQGLAIIAGPSGHGKTATLAALVDHINRRSAHHIICIEDPIEVVHPVARAIISQRQVGRDTASYARALKACLREDPDVIVVGELRDKETVAIALGAAETGHLVLATMNTRSAGKTIDRLIDLFPPEDQAQVRATLAGSLKMVVSQRLVPGLKEPLVPAVELLTGGVSLWALIRDNKLFQLPSLQQRGRSAGMIRLDTSLLALVQEGRVHADVARTYAENLAEFDRLLAGAKGASPPDAPKRQNP